ncbi:MAG: hypothetical protein H6Q74_2640 [Firmicutes bacterium]|nr:hypothetical protein [Bacillota bacterium]
MIHGRLTIDQTPCRASYGILTPTARLWQTVAENQTEFLESLAETSENGDRLARIWNKANAIEEIAAEAYGYHPKEVAVKCIERPIINWDPEGGNLVNIRV